VTIKRRVSWNDCDPTGRIRFQAVFDWFVDAEVELLRSHDLYEVFGMMPRVAADATYSRALRFDDLVEIDIRVASLGRSSLGYEFVVSKDGEEAVRGTVTAVYVVADRAAPLPQSLRTAFGLPA
jgi:acyl-CoA thioester hydrolase